MTILDYIRTTAINTPDKIAIIYEEKTFTYDELYDSMKNNTPLPIPLLGDSWDSDFILHTSGTTGKQKYVVISQEAVIANSENLIEGHRYHKDLIFVIAGDMTHLGCWSKIFPTLMCGATLLILKDQMRDIQAFLKAFNTDIRKHNLPEHTKYATFLVPANLRILLQFASEDLKKLSPKIDFIETGASAMTKNDMVKLCTLLHDTRLYNTYASTETGIIATYDFNTPGYKVGCAGHALKHSSFSITEEGKIACSGKTLMTGYTDREINENFILDNNTIITNDKGFVDEEGMLHITGREDDVINVGGYKVMPAEIESIASEHPSIRECICIERSHPILGSTIALLIIPNNNEKLNKKEIAHFINARTERYKVPTYYELVNDIPHTPNGKPDRKHYKKQ